MYKALQYVQKSKILGERWLKKSFLKKSKIAITAHPGHIIIVPSLVKIGAVVFPPIALLTDLPNLVFI